jgi:hypothetical protein
MEKINLLQKFKLIEDHWNPRVAGQLNGQEVKLVKFKGEFVWHHHEQEDELFLVVKGSFNMELRDKTIELNEGDAQGRGAPASGEGGSMGEPASTLNTGNVVDERTRKQLSSI